MEDMKVYCFSGFVKHASLVNKIYPTQLGEEGPRSSDLSYLVFYAQHRPEKLPKVGRYLHKRYLWDAAKDRTAHHKVTLAIINALMDACPAHLCLFAESVVLILVDMSYGSDSELTTHISACFIKFCSHYDASLDHTVPMFFTSFASLIDRFCFLALPSSHVSNTDVVHDVHQLQLAGLEAMKAVAFSSFIFTSTNAQQYAAKIIPPILSNIRAPPTNLSTPTSPLTDPLLIQLPSSVKSETEAQEDAEYAAFSTHRRISIFDDVITNDELSTVALKALQKLARSANASAITHVLTPLFAFLDSSETWADTRFVGLVLQNNCTPMQTVLLSQLLTRLKPASPPSEFKHKFQVYKVFPQLNFGINCLAISLTEMIDTFATVGISEYPDSTKQVFIWLTKAFIPTALRELLVTMIPKISVYPDQVLCVIRVLYEQPSMSIGILELEPLFVVLEKTDEAYSEPRGLLIQLIYQSVPTNEVAPVTKLAPAFRQFEFHLVLHHWTQHPKQVNELIKLAIQLTIPESYALAALQTVPQLKQHVPELHTDPPSLSELPISKIQAILSGDSAYPSAVTDQQGINELLPNSVSPPPGLTKTHSVLRFGSIERKATPEEFHNILNGKSVTERPISMGHKYAQFQFPINKTELDNVLDNI